MSGAVPFSIPTAADAAGALREVAISFHQADPSLARRLEGLASDLDASNLSNWAGLDLYRTFDPQRAEEALLRAYELGTHRANLLEMARNIVVLFPILVTWFALSRASAAYSNLLASPAHSADRSLPFLLLWQRRFDGTLPANLTFSNIAQLDAALLFLIIVLTALSHARSGVLQTNAARRVEAVRHQLEDAIWKADLTLHPSRVQTPQTLAQKLDASLAKAVADITNLFGPAAAHFQAATGSLITRLEGQEQRIDALAAQRQLDADVLAKFVQPFTGGALQLQAAAGSLQQAAAQVQPTMHDIKDNTAQLQAVAASQHHLLAAIQGSMSNVVNHERVMAQELQSTAALLSDTADRNQEVATELARQAADATAVAQQVAKIAADLQAAQAAIAHDLKQAQSGFGTALKDVSHESRQVAQSAASLAVAMRSMVPATSDASAGFTTATTALRGVEAQLSSLATQIQPATVGLPQHVRELGDVIAASVVMLGQLQGTFQQLNTGTEQLAQAVSRFAAGANGRPSPRTKRRWWPGRRP